MNENYWNRFYEGLANPLLDGPSSFAIFIAERLTKVEHLIELGCGNGRDFRLLSGRAGRKSIGLDASVSAIEICKTRDPAGSYVCGNLDDFYRCLEGFDNDAELLIYGRFFLHAITPKEQRQFVSQLAALSFRRVVVALEYRVIDDARLGKVYDGHDRYYVDHDFLVSQFKSAGYVAEYEVVSRGLSTFKGEDPLVGRLLISKDLVGK